MAYFFRVYRRSGTRVLIEMEPHEARAALRGDDPLCRYEPCPTQRAHQWVRSGDVHETALFVDMDGRIRRATENS